MTTYMHADNVTRIDAPAGPLSADDLIEESKRKMGERNGTSTSDADREDDDLIEKARRESDERGKNAWKPKQA